MTGKNVKKLISRDFKQFALEHGFTNSKAGFNYCCANGIMKAIGFEYKSSSACALYFIFPLYMGKYDYIPLEYGDTLQRKGGSDYIIYYDFGDDEISAAYSKIKKLYSESIIPKMNSLCTAEDLIRECSSKEFFASQPINILELKAYSTAYLGQYEAASDIFREYLKEKEKLTAHIDTSKYSYPQLLRESPSGFKKLMEENIEYTVEANKLIY